MTIPDSMDSLIESTAKQVYRSMRYACINPTPEWVDGGNSIMQDEARRCAKAILEAVGYCSAAKPEPEVQFQPPHFWSDTLTQIVEPPSLL